MWPKSAGASGYHVYLNDGNGTFRQVGSMIGAGAVSWSSSGDAFYPGDSEIATLGSGSDPHYRATTPADGTTRRRRRSRQRYVCWHDQRDHGGRQTGAGLAAQGCTQDGADQSGTDHKGKRWQWLNN
jgi:hypothetical protein